MIRASKPMKALAQAESKKSVEKVAASLPKKSPQNIEAKSRSKLSCVYLYQFNI